MSVCKMTQVATQQSLLSIEKSICHSFSTNQDGNPVHSVQPMQVTLEDFSDIIIFCCKVFGVEYVIVDLA